MARSPVDVSTGGPGAARTIHEAASDTGWSPRMLRYLEQLGLVTPPRSTGGYRLYGDAQLTRLRSLRTLLDEHGLGLGDVAFALRLRRDRDLAVALDGWFDAEPPALDLQVRPPAADDWLGFEQDKHQQLLHP